MLTLFILVINSFDSSLGAPLISISIGSICEASSSYLQVNQFGLCLAASQGPNFAFLLRPRVRDVFVGSAKAAFRMRLSARYPQYAHTRGFAFLRRVGSHLKIVHLCRI